MFAVGVLVIIATIIAIIKRYEANLVLFIAGLVMTIVAGQFNVAIETFTNSMVNKGLVPVICSVMGFAFVMKKTECDIHLVHLLADHIKKYVILLIPSAVIITWLVNIALPTAAGCAAAVGIVLIPTLIKAGVHPVIAASCILAGTWGSVLNPGTVHNPFIAKIANTDPMSIVLGHTLAASAGVLVIAVALTIVAYIKKENTGYVSEYMEEDNENFKVHYIKAFIPVLPLLLLVLGSKQINVIPNMSVLQAMLIGTFVAFIVTRVSPSKITKEFCEGMGNGYGSVVTLIVAAAVFVAGMQSLGIVDSLIEYMKNSQGMAKVAAAWGPFLITVLSGSGDAVSLAFNGAITPFAADFGLEPSNLGSLAYLSGGLGRSMCPVVPVSIICAQLAGVETMDMAKRNAIPAVLALLTVMFIL